MDDKEAVHRITRAILKRHWWLSLFLLAPMLSALRGSLHEDPLLVFLMVFAGISFIVPEFLSRATRMLPVSRKMLARTLWQLGVGYPAIIIAELSAINALGCTLTGDTWREAWGRAAYSYSYFLLIDGALFAGVALGFLMRRGHSEYDIVLAKGWTSRLKPGQVLLLFISALFLFWVFVIPAYLKGPRTGIMKFNIIVGGVLFVASYLLRNKLIFEQSRLASAETQSVESGLVWPTPGRDPWKIALLKHMYGTIVWSACNGFVTIAACTLVLEFPRVPPFRADVLVGMIVGAAILNVGLAWGCWNGELRAWRMLPLSRAQLGISVSGFMAAASVFPWALAFAITGLILVSKGCLNFSEQFSLLGVSVAIQGMLFAVLPGLFRGLGDTLRAVLSIVTVFTGIGCVLISVPLLVKFENLVTIDLRTHGWAWMATGTLVLCAGMAVSAWHTSRVLRHGDCYKRTTE